MFSKNETGTGTVTHVRSEKDEPWISYYLHILCPDDVTISETVVKSVDDEPIKKGDTVSLIMGEFFWQIDE